MYYKIVAGQNIFDLNPGLLAVPNFKDLTDMQMKYVCFVCDPSNDNPVRTLQGKTKREKAALLSGYKMETDGKRLAKNARDIVDGNVKSIENAISTFKELHYDKNLDAYETVSALITRNIEFIKESKEDKKDDGKKLEKANKLLKELPALIESRQKVEALLNVEINYKPDVGATYTTNDLPEESESDEPLSTLDKFMMSKQ